MEGTTLLKEREYRTRFSSLLLLVTVILLAYFTTSEHVKARGIVYLAKGNQIKRHQNIMDSKAGNPWQYRVLSAYIAEGMMKTFKAIGIKFPILISFILLRFFLDAAIFCLAFLYFKKLGLGEILAFIGISLLAWGMSYAHYDSDLQFSTYLDVIFYLVAGICILHKKYIWIIPISLLASLNRETSGLIPFLLLFSFIDKEAIISGLKKQKGNLVIFGISFTLYIAIFFLLRFFYGEQKVFIPYGHNPGFDLLHYNLTRIITWNRLLATLGIVPLLSILGYSKWHAQLKTFFWVIIPIWLIIHMFGAIMAEARLFLVPNVMVFIPGVLLFAQQSFTNDRGKRLILKDSA